MRDVVGVVVVSMVMRLLGVLGIDILPSASSVTSHPIPTSHVTPVVHRPTVSHVDEGKVFHDSYRTPNGDPCRTRLGPTPPGDPPLGGNIGSTAKIVC